MSSRRVTIHTRYLHGVRKHPQTKHSHTLITSLIELSNDITGTNFE